MNSNSRIFRHRELAELQILLYGVPCTTSRGWLGYCTVTLFSLEGEWALFDTGHYSDRSVLLAVLNEAKLDPSLISHVVLSHLHFDHILNLSLFQNASVTLSQAELDYARRVASREIDDPSIPDLWPALFQGRKMQIVEEKLDLSESIQLVTMPGHTPGCLVMFWEGPSTIAVCGDVIKNGWEALTGEPTTSCADRTKAKASISRVMERARVIVPGHDRPLVRRADGLDYLTDFSWQIRGNMYPRPQDEVIFNLSSPAGFYPWPWP
ncbi:MAG: MBL fold metallo-hydrolase [Syntrophobacteraceae bacterium]